MGRFSVYTYADMNIPDIVFFFYLLSIQNNESSGTLRSLSTCIMCMPGLKQFVGMFCFRCSLVCPSNYFHLSVTYYSLIKMKRAFGF